ncbi:hypothetical protein [Paraburkholderia fungorum]|nr:hypothetical protein [Paraburkholderia fungorum]
MVSKTIRRTFSGLTLTFSPDPKGKQGVAYTVKAAQQRADEAWIRTTQAEPPALHSVKIHKRDFR